MIVVWFSCGAASAVAAKLTLEKYPNEIIRVVNNPIKEEHPDNMRFLKDVEKWIGREIEFALNPKFPKSSCVEVWEKRRYMSGVGGAPCTLELKKRARQEWEKDNNPDWHVLGFTVDEQKRFDRFKLTERENTLPVLIDAKLTKDDCFQIVKQAGIRLPEIYTLGFPNANCLGCVKSSSPSYWALVREKFPDVFNHRAEQSKRIGCRLIKYQGKRIFLDELPDRIFRKPKKTNIECGIFCEERD